MAIAGSLVVTVSARTQDFENGMRKTTQTIRLTEQQVKGLTSTFSQLGTTLSAVTTRANATSNALSNTQSSVGALSSSLVGLAAGVLTVQTLTSAISDVVRVGTEMQNLRTSFAAISGGAQAGNREFAFVVKTANSLGLEIGKLAEQYRSLMAATRGTALEGQATRDLFTALTQAATTFGLSTDQVGRALTAMQQIVSKGKVSMEELRGQLGEALPGAMQIAARAYNTNSKALEDMVAKGLDATEFATRFTAQLKVETPLAAERAGKGIAQLGNEILLLKDRIAQSGLLQFLDDVAAKLSKVLQASRTTFENARSDVERMLGPLSKWATEAEKSAMIETAMGKNAESILQRDIAVIQRRAQEQEKAVLRQKEINEQQIANQAILRDQASNNKQLTEALTAQKKAVDDLNKASASTPEIYGKINGTLKEQIQFLEKRKAITEKSLETLTTTITSRTERSGAAPADLLAQKTALQQQYAADVAGIEKAKQAIQDLETAKRKAAQAEEERKRKAKQLADETARLDLQQMEEVARVHAQNIATLRTLSERYTSVRAERDADTASMLKAALATSQYASEAQRLAAAIEDVQRIEAQLPTLRSEAKTSAAQLERYQQALEDMKPETRHMTRQEELQRRYEEFAKTTSDQEQLRRVKTEMETTLHTERMQQLYDHLNTMAEELSNTFVDMAVTGEFSFKRLMESFSRMVLDMTADAIGLKEAISGWLKQALGTTAQGGQPGSGLLGSLGGLFGGGAGGATYAVNPGTVPTGWSVVSGGGLAAGGPVMPNRFYTVGERGPETFIPGQPGTIVPNGGLGGVTVNMHIVTPDVGGFRSSQRQLWAEAMRQGQQARRVL